MKKICLFSVPFLLFVLSALQMIAQGFNSSYAVINAGSDIYYCMFSNTSCGANPGLDGANLGQFREGSAALTLKGGQVNNYKCSGQDISSVRLNYRIYLTTGTAGSFTVIDLPFSSDFDNGCGGKDQQWQNLGANVNVLNGLSPGNYTIEFYCDQSTSAGTQYLSNSNNNYKATFSVFSDFISTWKTDNAGTSSSTSITIPTTGTGYNYDVDWNNDGVYDEMGITGNVTHDFGAAGTYTIRIRGIFPRIYFNNGGDKSKLLTISQWGNIAWTSMEKAFYGCGNLNITATDVPDLSGTTDMSYMFADCYVLNSPANIGSWNTSTVTKMNYMFSYASAFNQPIGNWNTSAVTNMVSMFYYAVAFNQPIGNWNTSAVTTMSVMFAGAWSFNQPIGNWNTSAVGNMSTMLQEALSFNQYLGNWTLKSGVVMNFMLNNCGMNCANYSATLIGWSNNPATPNGRNLGATGRQYSTVAEAARTYLTTTKGWTITGDAASGSNCDPEAFITTWKTDNDGTTGSTSIRIPTTGSGYNYNVDWNNDGVYDQFGITGDVTHNFGVAGIYTIRIRGAFPRIYMKLIDSHKLLNVSQWGSIAWTSMASAFEDCINLNITATDIPDMSGVTDMSRMFYYCTSLNGPENIGSWNTSTVTNMVDLFREASSFNQPIGNWNTSLLTNLDHIFWGAVSFNQPINGWNTSSITSMELTFYQAFSFNQDLSGWNTSAVTNMYGLFYLAYSFNQNLGTWGLNSNVYLGAMLMHCGMNCANYSATLIGWSNNPLTPSGRNLGASGRQYNYAGLAARNNLVTNKLWTITDGGNGASSLLAATAGGGQVCQNVDVTSGKLYADGSCNSIAMLIPNGASPVAGAVNTCVTIDAVMSSFNGQPYLQRHFDITPVTSPTTSTARITLYVLQTEFDEFNAGRGVFPALPNGAADAAGKANLRITQYSGSGTAPGNYIPGMATLIDPDDADIVWNGYHWEISFNVTGFSGFYIHTLIYNAPLPVTILSFSGYKAGSVNYLSWITASEQNNRGFEVQRSFDGVNYTTIGFVNTMAAGGNSDVSLSYRFTDNNPAVAKQYYRLNQADINGKSKLSNVIVIKGEKPIIMAIDGIYPNPSSTQLNVNISSPVRNTVTFFVVDLTGRVLVQQVKAITEGSNTIPVNVASLSSGSYILKVVDADFNTVNAAFIKQ